jgi:sugar phosphate isomerase/epimerase
MSATRPSSGELSLGIFAKTFPGSDASTVLAAVRSAGYVTAQYNLACSGLPSMPDVVAPEVAADVARAAAQEGLSLAAVSGTFNMIHPDPAQRARGMARLRTLAEACGAMGTRLITLCTGTVDPEDMWRAHPDNDQPESWRALLVAMEQALEIAERYDLHLGVEPELANVVNSTEKAAALIRQLGSSRVKIVLDPANLFEVASLDEQRRVVSHALDLLAEHIVMGHAKDRWADGRFATAGQGVLDYPHYLKALKASGFSGPLITHGLAASEAAPVAEFLRGVAQAAGWTLSASVAP